MAPQPAVGVDIVVLTALNLEYDAIRAHLTDVRSRTDARGTWYEIGRLHAGPCRVAIILMGEGNLAAAALASHAVEQFMPKAVLLVGVAGGLKADAALGDVVVATRIYAYHGGREETAGFRPRPQSWPISHAIDQVARAVARNNAWIDPSPGDARAPAVHFKPLVSGEVVLDSRVSPLATLIAQHYSDAIAIDMESAGVAEAAHRKDFHRVVTIRGISDAADGDKQHTDTAGWQQQAAVHAAAFAMALAERISHRGSATASHSRPAAPSRARVLLAAALISPVLALTGAASQTSLLRPPASTPGSGWVRMGGAANVTLGEYQTFDLDKGTFGEYDSSWPGTGNLPGMDVSLSDYGRRLGAVRKPTMVALLDTSGTHDPNRCTARSTRFSDAIKNDAYSFTGRDICVAIDGERLAILTIDTGADPVRQSLTFHYTIWQRPGPRGSSALDISALPSSVPSTHMPGAPGSGWARVGGPASATLGNIQTIDLDTGALGEYDASWPGTGNLPGMDVSLSDSGKRLGAVREPTMVALLDTSGAHDPNRCTDRSTKFGHAINDNGYSLQAGRDVCVAIDGEHLAILTVDTGADPVRPSLTFHYTVWQRSPK